MSLLTYDSANMQNSTAEFRAMRARAREAHAAVEDIRTSGTQGFFELPFDMAGTRRVEAAAARTRAAFSELLVIGIGGSDLGARTMQAAVGGRKMRIRFLTNPDPDAVASALDSIDWKHTAVNVVSKSGTTLETMSLFEIVRSRLRAKVGKTAHAAHVTATTEESETSRLYCLARREGYAVIPHPTNVGGRFSVLSAVGLYPVACGGANVRRILDGASSFESARRNAGVNSLSLRFTTHQCLAYEKGRKLHVLMPYAEALFPFALWYRQLWAESLGKRRGNACVGPTPIAAYGATDQHSQIQLYNDGPDDKAVTFIQCERFKRVLRVPRGPSLAKILHAERAGTAHALAQSGRANGTLHIPSISPESVGALFMLYETSVAYMAALLDVNAFDQPGVEAGKVEAARILGETK